MPLERIRELQALGDLEQARTLILELAGREPRAAAVQYEAACIHDRMGLEREAVPFYLAAIRGDLSREDLRGAYLGLGSTYRALGEYRNALDTFDAGLVEFPGAPELRTFRAMALHNLGRANEAVEELLLLLAATTSDEAILQYRRAIVMYAGDLERTWG